MNKENSKTKRERCALMDIGGFPMKKRKTKVLFLCFLILLTFGIFKIGTFFWNEWKIENNSLPILEKMHIPKEYEKVFKNLETKYTDNRIEKMQKRYREYPLSLLELLLENEETFDFVYEYPDRSSSKEGTILKKEIEKELPTFYQWDQRWGYIYYGEDVLALTGCAPTSLSMILSYLKQDPSISPAALASFAEKNNLYQEGQDTFWAFFEKAASLYNVFTKKIAVSKREITNRLNNKQPIILRMKPGDFTKTGHFIVVSGFYKDGTLMVHDPNSKARSLKHWEIETVLEQATSAWVFYN